MNKKEAYADKFKAQLDEWKADIDKLEAKAKKAGADARIKYADEIEALRDNRNSIKYKLSIIQDVGEEEWEEFKKDIEKINSIIKKEIEEMRAKFS